LLLRRRRSVSYALRVPPIGDRADAGAPARMRPVVSGRAVWGGCARRCVIPVTPNRLALARVHPAMRRLLLPLLALLLPVLLVPGTAFGATATVKTASTAAGTVLVNQHGKSLYMFGKDR